MLGAAAPRGICSSNAAALGPIRFAEPFERLRDRSDAYLAQHGTRPKVFLACLGRAADFNARASFAKSLFEAGGIEAVEGNGDNLAKRFKESGAKLACLCSSDKVYAREAADAAKALGRSRREATSIWPASRAPTRAALGKAPALAASFTRAVIRLQILNAAYDEI